MLYIMSRCLRQPRHRAKNVGRAPTHLFASFPLFQGFVANMHSRTHTNEQEHCYFVRKYALGIDDKSDQVAHTLATNHGLEASWGRVWGVLEPGWPKNPPGCILGCENHVRGSPLGDAFWYNSGVFLCFFLLSFRPCAQNGILWIFMRF